MAIVTIQFHPFDDIGIHNLDEFVAAMWGPASLPALRPQTIGYGNKTLTYEIDSTFAREVERWESEGFNMEEFVSFKYEPTPRNIAIPAEG